MTRWFRKLIWERSEVEHMENILEIKDLVVDYGIIRALKGINMNIPRGQIVVVLGANGAGKTTTMHAISGVTKTASGQILYEGHDLAALSDSEFRPLRADLQMVFQDTLSSLNPRSRIGQLLEEPLVIQKIGTPEERRQKVLDALTMVGLSEEHYFRYPHELSGGQVQRLGIARAMIIEPKLIVCDEPVSALDVSIQAQILNMLTRLQKEMDLSLLFISHDIGVVRYISHRIGVMYLGTLVEEAETEELFANTLHPYTKALFSSIPDFNRKERKVSLSGELPQYTDEFKGCVFHTRCPHACDKCFECAPRMVEVTPGHKVACHRVGQIK